MALHCPSYSLLPLAIEMKKLVRSLPFSLPPLLQFQHSKPRLWYTLNSLRWGTGGWSQEDSPSLSRQNSHQDQQDVSLSWDYMTRLTDAMQKAVLFTHWQYMKAVSINTNNWKASSSNMLCLAIRTRFQYILISIWLYVLWVQNAFKCYLMWFQSNQLVLQQKQKNQNTSSCKGGGKERESENDVWCIQKRNDINNSMNS